MHGPDDAALHALLATCIHRHNIERLKENWVDVYRDVNTGSTSSKGIRPAAFAIVPYRSVEDENVRSTTSQKDYLPITKPVPYVVIRINSSDRKTNITERNECAKRGIEQCVVVDREKQKIKVYSFDDEYYNGVYDDINQHPQVMGSAISNHSSGLERCEYKYKKVFRDEEVIRVRYLYELKVTASDLLDSTRSPSDAFSSSFQRWEDIEPLFKAAIVAARAAEEACGVAAETCRAAAEAWSASSKAHNKSSAAWRAVSLATWRGKCKRERRKLKQEAKKLSNEADKLFQEAEKLSQVAEKAWEESRKAVQESRKACTELRVYKKKIIRTTRRRGRKD